MANVLEVNNLIHRYSRSPNGVEVLSEIDLRVKASELVVVSGASGAGKTTLLLACGAMQKPTSGTVKISGQDVFQIPSTRRGKFRSRHVGYLFQTLQLIPYLNLLDNVRVTPGADSATARIWLDRVGLSHRLTHRPESLSQGERQRAALARAVAQRPALLVADEPTGNLDPQNTSLVFQALREFADEGGAVLVASHDPMITDFANRKLTLESGSLLENEFESSN